MSSSKPILFYSKNDQRSINFGVNLSRENRLDNFLKICVDNNNKIPYNKNSSFYLYKKADQLYLDRLYKCI